MTAAIRVGSVVELDDGDYVVDAYDFARLKLRNVTSGDYLLLALRELGERLATPPSPVLTELPAWSALDNDAKERARFIEKHLLEVLHGTPLREQDPPRDEYDPEDSSLSTRIKRKAAELRNANLKGFSERNLWRLKDAYENGGLPALVETKTRDELPLDRADPRYVEELKLVIAEQTQESTLPAPVLLARVKRRLLDKHPGQAVPVPARSSFHRHLAYLTKGAYTTGNAKNRRTNAGKPDSTYRKTRVLRPGQLCEMDTTTFDVICLDDDGNPVRPLLTVLFDVATGCIAGSAFRLGGTKGSDHAFVLLRALTPRELQPGRDDAWAKLGPQLRWAEHIPANERAQLDLTRPYIVPTAITTDNGKDYLAPEFAAVCARFGIRINRARSRTATDKPHIERYWGTISTKFAAHLAGFTGGSVDRRGHALEKKPLLTLDALNELFDDWVTRVWHNTPLDGLHDPYFPNVKLTPLEAYTAMWDLSACIPVPISQLDFIYGLPTKTVSIQKTGMRHANISYDSPTLNQFRLVPGPENGGYRYHYHPYDPSRIWVWLPGHDAPVECLRRDEHVFSLPFAIDSSDRYRAARAARADDHREAVSADEAAILARSGDDLRYATPRVAAARRLAAKEQLRGPYAPPPVPALPEAETEPESVVAMQSVRFIVDEEED
ncbi:DDE-type integrase/transposase/recombinase [Agromyces mediolanus]|uniref:Integrase catalytic domain-containing protein n=1 Tax=Agromyces mediolanus TaxID=41986 RepID=A0A918C9Y5_AGRME|nr:DDE-type integrase/transposase/recombinase [Agromyces mediolanus]GGR13514.1 hypothetical protein GCM10010196_02550 [Agromyces mediolanus]GLJ72659.1 hypothetical protein GCM10017583_19150 [Agromyces mediolanus]